MLNFLLEPLQYGFMLRGLAAVVMVGLVCAVVGTFVVLRGMAFFGDALSHAILPGVAVAYLAGGTRGPLFWGALGASVLTALGIGAISRDRRLREDTAIGVVFAGAFALGIALISSIRSYSVDLTHILFGNILAIVSGFAFALFTIFMRKQKDVYPLDSVLLGNLLTAVIGLPFLTLGMPDGKGWLLVEFGGLRGLSRASVAELRRRRGLGDAKIAQLKAALALASRLRDLPGDERPAIRSPEDVFTLVGFEMSATCSFSSDSSGAAIRKASTSFSKRVSSSSFWRRTSYTFFMLGPRVMAISDLSAIYGLGHHLSR
jgi:hypothetical protein